MKLGDNYKLISTKLQNEVKEKLESVREKERVGVENERKEEIATIQYQ